MNHSENIRIIVHAAAVAPSDDDFIRAIESFGFNPDSYIFGDTGKTHGSEVWAQFFDHDWFPNRTGSDIAAIIETGWYAKDGRCNGGCCEW